MCLILCHSRLLPRLWFAQLIVSHSYFATLLNFLFKAATPRTTEGFFISFHFYDFLYFRGIFVMVCVWNPFQWVHVLALTRWVVVQTLSFLWYVMPTLINERAYNRCIEYNFRHTIKWRQLVIFGQSNHKLFLFQMFHSSFMLKP